MFFTFTLIGAAVSGVLAYNAIPNESVSTNKEKKKKEKKEEIQVEDINSDDLKGKI